MRFSAFLLTSMFLFCGAANAKTAAKASTGLHTGNRILIPADDSQELNFVVHRNIKNKSKINAPLLWIEYVADENGKSRKMQLKSQGNLSSPESDPAPENSK